MCARPARCKAERASRRIAFNKAMGEPCVMMRCKFRIPGAVYLMQECTYKYKPSGARLRKKAQPFDGGAARESGFGWVRRGKTQKRDGLVFCLLDGWRLRTCGRVDGATTNRHQPRRSVKVRQLRFAWQRAARSSYVQGELSNRLLCLALPCPGLIWSGLCRVVWSQGQSAWHIQDSNSNKDGAEQGRQQGEPNQTRHNQDPLSHL
ncbi:hypothetical protein V8C35DRAFT_39749 [Trichoderma chlorosporum]